MPRIAVMWFRFGPYHLARLRGASASARSAGAEVIGLEVASRDDVYAWAPCCRSDEIVDRLTVFPGENYHEISARRIRSGVITALERLKPDAVAINGWSVVEARAALGWCSRSGAISIVMSETKEDDVPVGRRVWWREAAKRWILKRFNAALVGGRAQADYLAKLGFPHTRIALGYDAVDNDYFERGAEEARRDHAALRKRYSLPARYFLASTRFVARKNVDGLLRAYRDYLTAMPDSPWGLVIMGSGKEEGRWRGVATELGLEGVIWPGFVQYEELPVYYGLASAFVHPAMVEPWGLVVNEAAACGLPLVLSCTVGSGLELLRDGENGVSFDPREVADISRALREVAVSADDEREAMGRRSREIASQWSPSRFGDGLMQAIEAAGGFGGGRR